MALFSASTKKWRPFACSYDNAKPTAWLILGDYLILIYSTQNVQGLHDSMQIIQLIPGCKYLFVSVFQHCWYTDKYLYALFVVFTDIVIRVFRK